MLTLTEREKIIREWTITECMGILSKVALEGHPEPLSAAVLRMNALVSKDCTFPEPKPQAEPQAEPPEKLIGHLRSTKGVPDAEVYQLVDGSIRSSRLKRTYESLDELKANLFPTSTFVPLKGTE